MWVVEFLLVDSDEWLIDHSPYDPSDKTIRTIDEERVLDRSLLTKRGKLGEIK